MITIETIGVGFKEDFEMLEQLIQEKKVEYTNYYEDYDPTPWNIVVKADSEIILDVLRTLDSKGVYYETTMGLPTC